MRYLLTLAIGYCFLIAPAQALSVLTINTDRSQEHTPVSQIVDTVTAETSKQWLTYYQATIDSTKADIVVLTNLAQQEWVTALTQRLSSEWHTRYQAGSVKNSGIAILSRWAFSDEPFERYQQVHGYSRHEIVRAQPLNLLMASIQQGEQKVLVVAPRFTAGTGDYAEQRYAQADAVRSVVNDACNEHFYACIVTGDLQDIPGSEPLKRLRGADGLFSAVLTFDQPASVHDYSYRIGNEGYLTSHILGTLKGEFSTLPLPKHLSGHHPSLFVQSEDISVGVEDLVVKPSRKNDKKIMITKIYRLESLAKKQEAYIESLEARLKYLEAMVTLQE